MIVKNSTLLKSRFLFLFLATFIFACEDDVREVTLYDKGMTEANASSTNIQYGESVDFTSTSQKALTTNWTFEGGSPESSINPNVTVTYNTPGVFEAKLLVKYIDNTVETKVITINVAGIDPPLPYNGTAVQLEGTIEAENYDLGGEGVGYHDNEEENLAVINGSAVYREDDGVDIVVDETTYIRYTNEGEWANYTVNVAEAGNFDFEFMVASANPAGGKSIQLQAVDQNTGVATTLGETGDFESTGGDTVFTGKIISSIALPEGSNTLRFRYTGSDTNLDKVNVIGVAPTPPIEGLGVFTERAITASNPGETPVNNGSFVITLLNSGAYEGTNAYLYHFDPVNSGNTGNGFALSIMDPSTSPLDATPYNYYNIALKTNSTKNLRVRMNTSVGNYWITLSTATDANYGMARDGAWHSLKIPIADFKKDGNGEALTANSDKITACLVMRSDDADYATYSSTEGAFDWYIDDIYYSVD